MHAFKRYFRDQTRYGLGVLGLLIIVNPYKAWRDMETISDATLNPLEAF